jgi:putative transposase
MPRKSRLNVPGAVYHVMARCLGHVRLFPDDEDREFFLSLLGRYLERTGTQCYAWAVMDTHYHLVLRLSDRELWELMKPLNMHYAHYHRQRSGRRGPLFMDRFKSIATQDQKYVQELVRYVHLNPVRAGVCKDIDDLNAYRWTGHSVLMGKSRRAFQNTEAVLRCFGVTVVEARKRYREFLKEGITSDTSADTLIDLVRKSNAGKEGGRSVSCWVIGDQEFVKKALFSSETRRLRISRFERDGRCLEHLAETISGKFGIDMSALRIRHRGTKCSDARKGFAYAAAKEYHTPLGIIAEYLDVGRTAVSAMCREEKEILEKYKINI